MLFETSAEKMQRIYKELIENFVSFIQVGQIKDLYKTKITKEEIFNKDGKII